MYVTNKRGKRQVSHAEEFQIIHTLRVTRNSLPLTRGLCRWRSFDVEKGERAEELHLATSASAKSHRQQAPLRGRGEHGIVPLWSSSHYPTRWRRRTSGKSLLAESVEVIKHEVWETVTTKGSLRARDNKRWRGILDGIPKQRNNTTEKKKKPEEMWSIDFS